MMRLTAAFLALAAAPLAAAEPPKPLVTGLKNPESVAVFNGATLVTVIGDFDKDGDGGVVKIADGKAVPFAMNMDDPKGIAVHQTNAFVADKTRVWKIDAGLLPHRSVSPASMPTSMPPATSKNAV